jgi:phosphoglycolate phosphatase
MAVRRVIFDMDGTLTDTAKATAGACGRTAEELGLPPPLESAIKEAMGHPGLDYYRLILPGRDEALIRRFSERADPMESEMIQALGAEMLFEGIAELLQGLEKRGLELYIASTGSSEHVTVTLNAAGIRKYFTGVYCGSPDKGGTLRKIPGIGRSEEWLMVGDKRIDALAAGQNHIRAIGAVYGYCTPEEQVFFDGLIYRPGELLSLVN